jgi:xylan 1,4-beta-xylosidase
MKLLTTILFLIPLGISAQTPEPASSLQHPVSSIQNTYCNPMDINYSYNFEQLNEKISCRSGADPVIVNHRGEYYLFVTISGGWWHSKDLIHWDYVVPDKWPMEDMCAPLYCK